MLTHKQHRTLTALRDRVMTPDRFNQNGFAFDTIIPGTMIDTILEILEDHDKRIQVEQETRITLTPGWSKAWGGQTV